MLASEHKHFNDILSDLKLQCHKSVTNFSLFLLIDSLIMLAPFSSINLSNVKAQEYGTFDDEYDYVDDRYSQYPTDDKNMNAEQVQPKDFS